MHRRNFLQNAGIIMPSLLLVKPSLLTQEAASNVPLLLITAGGADESKTRITAAAKSATRSMRELPGSQVKDIAYSEAGFTVTTHAGEKVRSSKLVFHSSFSINNEKLSVVVERENSPISMHYNSGRNKKVVRPEMWATTTAQINDKHFVPFLKRKGNAFMCIS